MSLLKTPARAMIAAPYIVGGISSAMDPDPHVEKTQQAWQTAVDLGAPPLDTTQLRLAARIGGVFTAAMGGCLVFSKRRRFAAFVLALVTLPLAAINAPVWLAGDKKERIAATERLLASGTALGGLVYVACDRDGKPSRKWRKEFKQQERELSRARRALDAAK